IPSAKGPVSRLRFSDQVAFRRLRQTGRLHWQATLIDNLKIMAIQEMVTEAAVARFEKLELESGVCLLDVQGAYETYGTLKADRTNAVLVLHAFSGDAHAGGDGGWWESMIGPGKGFDTDQYFVICSNVLGGCRGTMGPGCINP